MSKFLEFMPESARIMYLEYLDHLLEAEREDYESDSPTDYCRGRISILKELIRSVEYADKKLRKQHE